MLVKITPQKALDNLMSSIQVFAKTIEGITIAVSNITTGVGYYEKVSDSVQTPNYGYESMIPEPEEFVAKKQNPLIIRYVRPLALFKKQTNPSFHNNGGITFGFKIDYANKKLNFTFALCMFEDNFNKNIAHTIISDRFDRGDFCSIDYNDTESLIGNVMYNEDLNTKQISDQLRTMMNMLAFITEYNDSILEE